MKVFWIILAIVFGCGALCCGGLFFAGKSAMEQAKVLNKEAEEFALDATNHICANWDMAELKKRLDPTASTSVVSLVEVEGKKLGPLVSAGPFAETNFSAFSNNGASQIRILVNDNATFKNGSAELRFALVKSNGQWAIQDLQVLPSSPDSSSSGDTRKI